jgi:hypothetical protein
LVVDFKKFVKKNISDSPVFLVFVEVKPSAIILAVLVVRKGFSTTEFFPKKIPMIG